MAPRSPSPHAALFEAVFSHPEHAASELQLVLPSELSSRFDWSSLALRPGSWSGATSFSELLDVEPSLRTALVGFVPDFRFVLDDISAATDAELRRRSAVAAAALFLLRDARKSTDLLAAWRRCFDVLRAIAEAPGGVAALEILLQMPCRSAISRSLTFAPSFTSSAQPPRRLS